MVRRTAKQKAAFRKWHWLGRLYGARTSCRVASETFPYLKTYMAVAIQQIDAAISEVRMKEGKGE